MILSRITAKAQTTIPRAVRAALGLAPGDTLVYKIDGGEVRLSKGQPQPDPFVNNFSTFTEWADELDSVFDNL